MRNYVVKILLSIFSITTTNGLISQSSSAISYSINSTCIDDNGLEVDSFGQYYSHLIISSSTVSDGLIVDFLSEEDTFPFISTLLPDTFTIGPFTHSGVGDGFQPVNVTIQSSGHVDSLLVNEALCGYQANNGLNKAGFICMGSMPSIVACAEPPEGVNIGGQKVINTYILTDHSNDTIVDVNTTGLFVDVVNMIDYDVYAFTINSSDLDFFLSDFQTGDILNLPAADGCYTSCGEFTQFLGCTNFDLALRKTTAEDPVGWGDTVRFDITLFNQGSIGATNIELTEYIPNGFTLAPSLYSWSLLNPNLAKYTLTDTIQSGDSLTVSIDLIIKQDAQLGDLINAVEISYAESSLGFAAMDTDGYYDDSSENDGNIEDDDINGMNDDEDDHDIATPYIFDLALRKTVWSAPSSISIGDTIEFMIEIFNQGNMAATNIEVGDFYEEGFSYPGSANPDWKIVGDHLETTKIIDLLPSESDSIFLKLVVDNDVTPVNLINFSEIIGTDDGNGDNANDADIDSSPDDDINNDIGGLPGSDTDNQINDNGFLDEDDHDVEALTFCFDLSCRGFVNVSLGDDCRLDLTPIMFLTDTAFSASNYEIIVLDDNGDTLGTQLDDSHIGGTFDVMIRIAGGHCPDDICWTAMTLEDKIQPSIMCVSDTIYCFEPLEFIGLVSSNSCNELEIEILQDDLQSLCDNDSIIAKRIRTFRYVDPSGNVSQNCTSEIYIKIPDINDTEFPTDTTLICTNVRYDAQRRILNDLGLPILMDSSLNQTFSDFCQIQAFYTDRVIFDTPCKKQILRMWTVYDWTCAAGDREVSAPQLITVIDTIPPTIQISQDTLDYFTSGPECETEILLTGLSVIDTCSSEASVTLYSQFGSVDVNNNVPLKLPVGLHEVFIQAIDPCDNVSRDTVWVRVIDNSPPLMICQSDLTISLADSFAMNVSAENFSINSFDNCSDVELLIRKMENVCTSTDTVFQDELTFCCAEVGNEVMVVLRAVDTSGNFSECMVRVNVVDKDNNCQNQAPLTFNIQGEVSSMYNDKMSDIAVNLHQSGQVTKSNYSNNEGHYNLGPVLAASSYMVAPLKNDDWLNGVSTLDLINIQNHLLGIAPFKDPHYLIASDLNVDENISAIDLVFLRRLILGYIDEIEGNHSWRFLWKGQPLGEMKPLSDMEFVEEYDIPILSTDMIIDWIGIKVGDVTGNVRISNIATSENRSPRKEILEYDIRRLDDVAVLDIYSTRAINMIGVQMAIKPQENLRLQSVQNGQLIIPSSHFRVDENGKIIISHNSDRNEPIATDQPLFSITFEGQLEDLDKALQLDEKALSSEIYTPNEVFPVSLISKTLDEKTELVLLQNNPNPWSESTIIPFYNPNPGTVEIKVYDINNRLILSRSAQYGKGYFELFLDDTDVRGNGVFVVEISDSENSAQLNMIKVD